MDAEMQAFRHDLIASVRQMRQGEAVRTTQVRMTDAFISALETFETGAKIEREQPPFDARDNIRPAS